MCSLPLVLFGANPDPLACIGSEPSSAREPIAGGTLCFEEESTCHLNVIVRFGRKVCFRASALDDDSAALSSSYTNVRYKGEANKIVFSFFLDSFVYSLYIWVLVRTCGRSIDAHMWNHERRQHKHVAAWLLICTSAEKRDSGHRSTQERPFAKTQP